MCCTMLRCCDALSPATKPLPAHPPTGSQLNMGHTWGHNNKQSRRGNPSIEQQARNRHPYKVAEEIMMIMSQEIFEVLQHLSLARWPARRKKRAWFVFLIVETRKPSPLRKTKSRFQLGPLSRGRFSHLWPLDRHWAPRPGAFSAQAQYTNPSGRKTTWIRSKCSR